MALAPIPTTCITNTVTLSPGESMTLAPGAKIIGSSNVLSISSVCVDLTEIEQLGCYVLLLAGVLDTGTTSDYFEKGQQKVIGIEYNGAYIPFTGAEILNVDSGGTYNMNLVYDQIKKYVPSIVFSNVTYFNTGSANNSSRSALAIKAYPSIIANLKVVLQAIANVSPGGGGSQVNFFSKFDKYSDLVASGLAGLPTC